jgi:hypothetical protein
MKKIVMLVGDTDTSRIMYHALKDDFNIVKVIEEQPESTVKSIELLQEINPDVIVVNGTRIITNTDYCKDDLPSRLF